MINIFESLLLLEIGLLGITVTIFVLAVSLLGRAIRVSVQEKQKAEEARKKETEDQIKEIQIKLQGLSTGGQFDDGQIQELQHSLKSWQKNGQPMRSNSNGLA